MWPVAGIREGTQPATPPQAGAAAAAGRAGRPLARGRAGPAAAPGINLVGYIAAELGVGEAARSLARACSAAGVPYSVVDVGFQTTNKQRDTQALANASAQRFAVDLVYVNADQTPATIAYLKSKRPRRRVQDRLLALGAAALPRSPPGAFAHLDEVWVPSNFVRDAVAAVSPLPVVVDSARAAVRADAGHFAQRLRPARGQAAGAGDVRLPLLPAPQEPAGRDRSLPPGHAGRDDCALVVKTINGDQHPQARDELRASLADLPGTVMIDEFLTRQQTWDLQSCCDMLVSLHRAEGFGLAPAEMMYLGKPVVATGWSANMDFMTIDNSMPVHYTLEPLAETLGAYPAGPLWAEADVGHAADCIRRLLDDAGLRAEIGSRAAQRRAPPAASGRRRQAGLRAPEDTGALVSGAGCRLNRRRRTAPVFTRVSRNWLLSKET